MWQMSTGMVGMACGLTWTFEFILVEGVAKEWEPEFPHLKLLLGLLMGVQCFLAEVPFFLVAGGWIWHSIRHLFLCTEYYYHYCPSFGWEFTHYHNMQFF